MARRNNLQLVDTEPEIRVAAAYIRCSTDIQTESPETQRALITEFAARAGYTIPPDLWFIDFAVSGGKAADKRPAFGKLLAMLPDKSRPYDSVIVVRGDRAFRNVEDQLAVMGRMGRAGVQLVGVQQTFDQETPQGRAMTTVLGAFQQLEREMTGQRIKDHNRERVRKHRWAGGQLATGFDAHGDGPMTINEHMPHVVAVFQAFVDAAGVSADAAKLLDERAVPTLSSLKNRNGTVASKWSVSAVIRTVRNATYRRVQDWEDEYEYSPDLIPGSIPPRLLRQVDDILNARYGPSWIQKRDRSVPPRTAFYTYTGLLSCGACGNYRAIGHDRNMKVPAHWWTCHSRRDKLCSQPSVVDRAVDMLVGRAIESTLGNIAAAGSRGSRRPRQVSIDERLAALEKKRDRVIESYVEGLITRERRAEKLAEIETERTRIEADATATITPEINLTAAQASTLRHSFHELWQSDYDARDDAKRAFLMSIGVPRHGIVVTVSDSDVKVEISAHGLSASPILSIGKLIQGSYRKRCMVE